MNLRTRRSEEKSPPLRHPGSNPGRPARSPAPCRLSHLALAASCTKCVFYFQTILGVKVDIAIVKKFDVEILLDFNFVAHRSSKNVWRKFLCVCVFFMNLMFKNILQSYFGNEITL